MAFLQRYPALSLALCFCTGIVFAWKIDADIFFVSLGAASVLLVITLATLVFWRQTLISLLPLVRTTCIFGAFVAASAAHYAAHIQLSEKHVAHLVAETHDITSELKTTVYGQIATSPHETSQQFRVVVELDSIQVDEVIRPIRGRAQLVRWIRDDVSSPSVKKGDVIAAYGSLVPTPRPRNPADMDYGAYLERRGIFAQLELENAHDLEVIAEQSNWGTATIEMVRQHINKQIDIHLSPEEAQHVLRALLLGDRSGIDADRREQFVRTGLMHLLAVSGLHVLLVGFVLYQLLQPFFLRLGLSWQITEVSRALITMVVLVLYMLLTETRPSVVRATVMAALFIGSSVLQRPSNSLNTLGVAAIILLIMRPTQLFDVGFQLSFAAVGAILLLNPMLTGWMKGNQDAWWAYFASIGTTTIAATIGTLPVLLVHFGFASFAGLLLNLLAIPATALGLAGGLLMVITATFWPLLANILGHASGVFLSGLLEIAAVGMKWFSWASVETTLTVWSVIIFAAGLGGTVNWNQPRVRWACVMIIAGVLALSTWKDVVYSRADLHVIYLDVGQANAALVKLPDGGHALFDAGLHSPFVDSGERTILPHLRHYGIDHLSAVVISHPHSDHLGGLASILQEIPVDTVYRNGDVLDTEVYRRTGGLIDSLSVEERVVRQGDVIFLSPMVHAKVLYPSDDALQRNNVNDASVVVRLNYGETSFLFLGDAEVNAERDMTALYADFVSADVVQVGHHGSITSSTRPLVQNVMENASSDVHAVISAGARNRYGHPAELVKSRWRYNNAHVHWTAISGALWFTSDGYTVNKKRWRK